MKRTIYKNLSIDGVLTDLIAEDGVIAFLGKTEEEGYDCKGLTARAGLFDIHIHGLVGDDAYSPSLDKMCYTLAKEGVTSWLPTTSPRSFEAMEAACKNDSKAGAKIRGFHLEGPFVNMAKKGALNPKHIVAPTMELLDRCPRATYMTIAPEIEGALDFIKEATEKRGMRFAIGHTVATHDEALEGIRAGANSLTHTFNAMAPLNHREPGPIGAAITGDAYVQVISDGFHLHPSVVLALYRIFGPERMILISDAVRTAGMPDGEYDFDGQTVYVTDGKTLLKDGTISGATNLLSEDVRRAISFGIPEKDAYRMASETPARFMGIKAGVLKEGYDADFALYDETNHAVLTVIDGEAVK